MTAKPDSSSPAAQASAQAATAQFAIQAASAEHLGGREEQQDRVAVFGDDGAALLVLADGLGGHAGGALAAQTVVDTAHEAWSTRESLSQDPLALVQHVRDQAHVRIRDSAKTARMEPMSTCVLLLLDGRRATWVHVGDSRLYRFRNGTLIGRTRDHSVAQVLFETGEIDEADMASRPEQAQLLSVLGSREPPQEASGSDEVRAGDGFVLCSDGLWETVTTEEMALALAEPDLGEAAQRLAALAEERGGANGDNVSVALARVAAPGTKKDRGSERLFERLWHVATAPNRVFGGFFIRWFRGAPRRPRTRGTRSGR